MFWKHREGKLYQNIAMQKPEQPKGQQRYVVRRENGVRVSRFGRSG